ncbi:MAG: isoprenyl transferase [Flexilinea sp.]|nr:isoprenyl transferase [Flexilinea sp.]
MADRKRDIRDIPAERIPRHVAIIMDGNGRWAKKRGMPRLFGHRAGVENLRAVIKACVEFGIRYLTIYAFSTENWGRPQDEVSGLEKLFHEAFTNEFLELRKQGVRIIHLGQREGIPQDLLDEIDEAVELSKTNDRLVLSVALNYGSRNEIMHAVRRMIGDGLSPEEITEQTISRYLFTADIPDPDLVIRTSGEQRLSNFLLYQSAYAEWEFPETLWPDFGKEQLLEAIFEYSKRDRRFGKV